MSSSDAVTLTVRNLSATLASKLQKIADRDTKGNRNTLIVDLLEEGATNRTLFNQISLDLRLTKFRHTYTQDAFSNKTGFSFFLELDFTLKTALLTGYEKGVKPEPAEDVLTFKIAEGLSATEIIQILKGKQLEYPISLMLEGIFTCHNQLSNLQHIPSLTPDLPNMDFVLYDMQYSKLLQDLLSSLEATEPFTLYHIDLFLNEFKLDQGAIYFRDQLFCYSTDFNTSQMLPVGSNLKLLINYIALIEGKALTVQYTPVDTSFKNKFRNPLPFG